MKNSNKKPSESKASTEPISMEEIQAECKRRFPIGCTFESVISNYKQELKDDDVVYSIAGNDIYAHNGAGCLYSDGEYAELISMPEPTHFKFIVGKWYKYNSHIGKYDGHKNNLFTVSEYIYNKEHYTSFSNWGDKSVDSEKVLIEDLSEIQEYLPDGHVDKFSSKSLVGRYLKALFDRPNSTRYKQGEYILIHLDNLKGSVKDKKRFVFGQNSYDWKISGVELMPEGFNPNEVKNKSYTIDEAYEELKRRGFDTDKKIKYKAFNSFGKLKNDILISESRMKKVDNSFIDCGWGYLWNIDYPDKLAEFIDYVDEIESEPKAVKESDIYPVDYLDAFPKKESNHTFEWKIYDFQGTQSKVKEIKTELINVPKLKVY